MNSLNSARIHESSTNHQQNHPWTIHKPSTSARYDLALPRCQWQSSSRRRQRRQRRKCLNSHHRWPRRVIWWLFHGFPWAFHHFHSFSIWRCRRCPKPWGVTPNASKFRLFLGMEIHADLGINHFEKLPIWVCFNMLGMKFTNFDGWPLSWHVGKLGETWKPYPLMVDCI